MTAFIPIASQTLASPASSVTFSSIPTSVGGKTIRDLVLVVNASRSTNVNATEWGKLQFNGDTGANYVTVDIAATAGIPAGSSGGTDMIWVPYSSHGFANGFRSLIQLQIVDFAQTNKHKHVMGRVSVGEASADSNRAVAMMTARWEGTAAITSLTFSGNYAAQTFHAGSTFNLFGLEG